MGSEMCIRDRSKIPPDAPGLRKVFELVAFAGQNTAFAGTSISYNSLIAKKLIAKKRARVAASPYVGLAA